MSQQHKILDLEAISLKVLFLTERFPHSSFSTLCQDSEWEMGIDEAGRGPVLGPMVYGCCCWPKKLKEELSSIGFFDSKQVTEENRERFFEILKNLNGFCLWYEVRVLDSELISNKMLQKNKENLNEISYNTAYSLINSCVAKVNLIDIYIDTVGKPDYYKGLLVNKFIEFPYLNFEVSEKADSKFPIVSAASIAAKVTRDSCVKNWQFREKVAGKIERNYGSGYPSDPNTVKWLNDNFDEVFAYVDFVRFSWKTIETLMEKKGLVVEFNEKREGFFDGCGRSWMNNLGLKENFQL